jgi:hypothetical protein
MRPPRTGSPPSPPPPPASRRREQRAIRAGLTVSAVLHLVALLIYPVLVGHPEGRLPSGEAEFESLTMQGLELVTLFEVQDAEPVPSPSEPPPTPAEPDDEPAVEDAPSTEVAGTPGPDEATEAAGEAVEDEEEDLTVVERLQPRLGDERIWAPIPPEFAELNEFERAELLLHGMIQSWNDSMAVAEALSERARDWTFTDSEGRRWGLAPGRLYLGDFSIPLPGSLELSPGPSDDWIRDDLARGAANAAIQETWTERARVIRQRMEADRAPSQSQDGDGG